MTAAFLGLADTIDEKEVIVNAIYTFSHESDMVPIKIGICQITLYYFGAAAAASNQEPEVIVRMLCHGIAIIVPGCVYAEFSGDAHVFIKNRGAHPCFKGQIADNLKFLSITAVNEIFDTVEIHGLPLNRGPYRPMKCAVISVSRGVCHIIVEMIPCGCIVTADICMIKAVFVIRQNLAIAQCSVEDAELVYAPVPHT